MKRLWTRLRAAWRGFSRTTLRDAEWALVLVAAVVGVGAGLAVVALREMVQLFHIWLFLIPAHADLSDGFRLETWRTLAVPTAGGLLVGLGAWALRLWRPRETVDAIEANALFGGRMSFTDSLNLAILSGLSEGCGASVGLESAFTQLGSAIASKTGLVLKLRRDDLRVLVGCGAAGALAAAFNAPLTGAFYAFELIIGSYTLGTLAPVTIAALAGTFTARATFGAEPVLLVSRPVGLHGPDYAIFVALGVLSAGLGILVMRGVTETERLFRARGIPLALRPCLGGLAVGLLALLYPQVFGSGHGGIVATLHVGFELPALLALIAAKTAASAISIGSGFRGGLFISSLFLGSLVGSAAARLVGLVAPEPDALAYSLVGMGTVACAVIGAPVTMILLVLEVTGDFSATIGVMVGVIAASLTVRQFFGYSFATWRFHLRGLKIRSPEDVGWFDDLKVGKLMRGDPKTVDADAPLSELRKAWPLGSTKRVFAVEGTKLLGPIDLAELHGPDLPGDPATLTARSLVRGGGVFLTPGDDVRTALDLFGTAGAESLAVVDAPETRRIVGYLTEAYALRRYNQELERRRSRQMGDSGLFGSTERPGN